MTARDPSISLAPRRSVTDGRRPPAQCDSDSGSQSQPVSVVIAPLTRDLGLRVRISLAVRQ
eukprot:767714-Hanusia_phi.AAC.8